MASRVRPTAKAKGRPSAKAKAAVEAVEKKNQKKDSRRVALKALNTIAEEVGAATLNGFLAKFLETALGAKER